MKNDHKEYIEYYKEAETAVHKIIEGDMWGYAETIDSYPPEMIVEILSDIKLETLLKGQGGHIQTILTLVGDEAVTSYRKYFLEKYMNKVEECKKALEEKEPIFQDSELYSDGQRKELKEIHKLQMREFRDKKTEAEELYILYSTMNEFLSMNDMTTIRWCNGKDQKSLYFLLKEEREQFILIKRIEKIFGEKFPSEYYKEEHPSGLKALFLYTENIEKFIEEAEGYVSDQHDELVFSYKQDYNFELMGEDISKTYIKDRNYTLSDCYAEYTDEGLVIVPKDMWVSKYMFPDTSGVVIKGITDNPDMCYIGDSLYMNLGTEDIIEDCDPLPDDPDDTEGEINEHEIDVKSYGEEEETEEEFSDHPSSLLFYSGDGTSIGIVGCHNDGPDLSLTDDETSVDIDDDTNIISDGFLSVVKADEVHGMLNEFLDSGVIVENCGDVRISFKITDFGDPSFVKYVTPNMKQSTDYILWDIDTKLYTLYPNRNTRIEARLLFPEGSTVKLIKRS